MWIWKILRCKGRMTLPLEGEGAASGVYKFLYVLEHSAHGLTASFSR